MTSPCDWHEGDTPLEEDEIAACCNCGRMIATRICESCGEEFYDWESESSDDIIAPPGVTSSGDFYCRPCSAWIDREEERQIEEEWEWCEFDPYDEDWD